MDTLTPAEEKRYAELQQIGLEAARKGDVGMLHPMLTAGLPLNLKDGKGNSLLMLAAYHGHYDVVDLLLHCGARPDERNDRGQTPLAGVAFKGYLDVAERLIEGGADPVADLGGGRTPVMFAALFGQREMVSYLCEVGRMRGTSTPSRVFGLKPETLSRYTAWIRTKFFKRAVMAA
ncbi:ankyrin repeat domain-containing protein [Coraliomargarita parva]|uniref:ankyrin repeat domain-containing protein n=1 Tax=Coraliomargarita parva TaxID=3014050 RepID=UPI0022B4A61F|nr:ankyrin repeat domain-containing protein [Coraliomargarita parva]